jgi:hypothetical protein
MALALGEAELHGCIGSGVTGFAIEGEIARGDLQSLVAGLAGTGGGRGAGQINLDVALADDVSA